MATERETERAVGRAQTGRTIDAGEAEALLSARGEQLDRLMSVARRVRDAGLEGAGRPGVVTYSKKVFIPLTRLCRDRCHYCTFVTTPTLLTKHAGAPFMSADDIRQIAREGAALGCKEALFTIRGGSRISPETASDAKIHPEWVGLRVRAFQDALSRVTR